MSEPRAISDPLQEFQIMPTNFPKTSGDADLELDLSAIDDHVAVAGADRASYEAQRAIFTDIDRRLARLETGIAAQKIAMGTLIDRLNAPQPPADRAPSIAGDRG